ncbi:AAA family ATPase [Pseudopedobacter beijingensis]|uniref:AAA family ATPase n=1 Tax=Pseudopedobacter beijingensis TaxID=1207056 RepID=A0ABW4IEJ0_9SPHI
MDEQPETKNNKLIKIAVVGPESSGKSTITEGLAKHFGSLWVPEYARFYCENLEGECTFQDEENMFFGQIALEEAISSVVTNNLLFCDTVFLTVKVWSEHQFGKAPQPVIQEIPKRTYDFFLLLKNDLPWQDDPLRNFKGMGDYFFNVWKNELESINANYAEVGGLEDRLSNAINTVELFLNK